jgi:BirA family biotin operon repressor/biotin-[acetyl-CoA-carboxylase] ligase
LRPRAGSGALAGPFVHLDVAGSTNDHARDLALAGAPHGTAVAAEQQTAGRGRQGRTWTAPPGRALTLSVVARLAPPAFDALPLAVALAICEACEAVAAVTCQLKWPNDVWIDRRKVAGVLIEARPQEGWAVVGIGLNVDTAAEEFPEDLRASAHSLRTATGARVDREGALDALFERLGAWVERLTEPARVTSAFRERDALRGQRIAWTAGAVQRTGEAGGVDEAGALVVFTDDGERVCLDAGEVHLQPA